MRPTRRRRFPPPRPRVIRSAPLLSLRFLRAGAAPRSASCRDHVCSLKKASRDCRCWTVVYSRTFHGRSRWRRTSPSVLARFILFLKIYLFFFRRPSELPQRNRQKPSRQSPRPPHRQRREADGSCSLGRFVDACVRPVKRSCPLAVCPALLRKGWASAALLVATFVIRAFFFRGCNAIAILWSSGKNLSRLQTKFLKKKKYRDKELGTRKVASICSAVPLHFLVIKRYFFLSLRQHASARGVTRHAAVPGRPRSCLSVRRPRRLRLRSASASCSREAASWSTSPGRASRSSGTT